MTRNFSTRQFTVLLLLCSAKCSCSNTAWSEADRNQENECSAADATLTIIYLFRCAQSTISSFLSHFALPPTRIAFHTVFLFNWPLVPPKENRKGMHLGRSRFTLKCHNIPVRLPRARRIKWSRFITPAGVPPQ